MRILLFIMAASLVVTLPAVAGIESIEVKGKGPSSTAAINAALVSAMQQVVGVNISSDNITAKHSEQSNEGFEFNNQDASKVSFGTAGSATYRILSDHCTGGQCTVRLRANVEFDDDARRQKSRKGMNANRRTLAIEPFYGNVHARELGRAIEARFVQDRLFSVVADRSKPGVDYVLRGTLVEAKTSKEITDTRRTLALTGESVGTLKARYRSRVIVEYQMIDLVNNQVKWSAKLLTTSARNNLPLLIDIASRKVFDQLKDNIYPLVLFATDDGHLVLNSGGKTVQMGELYTVFAVGEELLDPYTKESLGFTENRVGQVRVTRIQHKIAYVDLVSGKREDMADLPVARRSAAPRVVPKIQPKLTPKKSAERTSGFAL